ncbi:MAG: hypothetical protein Q4B58_05625 [Bacteroidales bacterium]|nr:hypothetical protein [Bacteroidales bacterium]
MTTIESILSRLTQAVSGTEKVLYTEDELKEFAEFYCDKWDENTSEDVIAESFVDFWWDKERTCRRCSECGKLMREGYCLDMGVAYYCSRECLHSEYTDEEWTAECEDNDQSYYTEW